MEFDNLCSRKEDYWNCGVDGFGRFPADEEITKEEFQKFVSFVKERSILNDGMLIATTVTAYQKKAAKALKLAGFKKVASCPGAHGRASGTCQLWVKTSQSEKEY